MSDTLTDALLAALQSERTRTKALVDTLNHITDLHSKAAKQISGLVNEVKELKDEVKEWKEKYERQTASLYRAAAHPVDDKPAPTATEKHDKLKPYVGYMPTREEDEELEL